MHPKTHRVEARGGHCCTDLGLAQWVANAELGRAIRHHPLMVLETRARFVLPKLMAQQALNPPKNVGGVRQGGWVYVWVLSPSKKGSPQAVGWCSWVSAGPGSPRCVSTVGSLRLSLSSPQPLEAQGMAAGLLLSVCCS